MQLTNHSQVASNHADAPTWGDAWRIECEARYLLSLPLEVRRSGLAHPDRAKRRNLLEADMRRLWAKR